MPTIHVTIKPTLLGRLERRFANGMRMARIRDGFEVSGRRIINMLRQRSTVIRWRGFYSEGWYYVINSTMMIISNDVKYFAYVEYGRGPGKRPPINQIRAWVLSKGMKADAAFPVAGAIAKRGIRPRPFFTHPDIQKEMASIFHKAMTSYLDKVLVEATR